MGKSYSDGKTGTCVCNNYIRNSIERKVVMRGFSCNLKDGLRLRGYSKLFKLHTAFKPFPHNERSFSFTPKYHVRIVLFLLCFSVLAKFKNYKAKYLFNMLIIAATNIIRAPSKRVQGGGS